MLNVGHSLTGRGKLFQSLPSIIDNTFCLKVVRLHGITQSPFTEARVLPPLSSLWKKPCSGGARLCNTLYTKQAYLRRLKLSKLKNVCLSKISQWWNDNAFLSKVFMAFLNKDSILLRVVVLVNDQFIKQYSICQKIIVYKNSLAALVSRNGLTCLKFCKFNLTLFATLKVRCFISYLFKLQ